MKLKLFIFSLLLIATSTIQGQTEVKITFGTPPEWAPANRVETQYYYLPDIDAYYDVPSAWFIYIKNGKWIRATSLPYRYRNYNLRGGNIIYLTDYRGTSPYKFHKNHKIKYPKKAHSTKVYVVKKEKNKDRKKNPKKVKNKKD